MMIFGRLVRLVIGYRGHNSGVFNRGPNWWQVTFPPSRKSWRCAVIVTLPLQGDTE